MLSMRQPVCACGPISFSLDIVNQTSEMMKLTALPVKGETVICPEK